MVLLLVLSGSSLRVRYNKNFAAIIQIPVYLLTDLTSPYFQGFTTYATSKYVFFSLVFALMSKLQGKVSIFNF